MLSFAIGFVLTALLIFSLEKIGCKKMPRDFFYDKKEWSRLKLSHFIQFLIKDVVIINADKGDNKLKQIPSKLSQSTIIAHGKLFSFFV